MEKHKRPGLLIGIGVSIAAHLLLFFMLLHFDFSASLDKRNTQLEVQLIEAKDLDQLLHELKDAKQKQIVEQNQINDEIDPNAKFLSANNQRVIKQTTARQHGDFQNASGAPGARAEALANKNNNAIKPNLALKNLLPERDLFGGYKQQMQKRVEKNQGKGGAESQTRDYLPDVDPGMETMLSTHEFVYYSYYNRIRNQLSQHWESKIKERILNLFKKGRKIASTSDHITKVLIILDAKGILMNVKIMSESGISDLDEVAVEAFRLAAPFPHPPKGIVEADGTIKIRWDFIVET